MTTTLLRSARTSDRALGGTQRQDLLDRLSPRELEVLALMAEGRSNLAICVQLAVGRKTVESHVSSVFTKLGLHDDGYGNRRVLAVLTLLGHGAGARPQCVDLALDHAADPRGPGAVRHAEQ